MQQRMSEAGAHIRDAAKLAQAKSAAWTQYQAMMDEACQHEGPEGLAEALRNRQLCFAHAVYLEALAFAVSSGTGSRGSALVTDASGTPAHPIGPGAATKGGTPTVPNLSVIPFGFPQEKFHYLARHMFICRYFFFFGNRRKDQINPDLFFCLRL